MKPELLSDACNSKHRIFPPTHDFENYSLFAPLVLARQSDLERLVERAPFARHDEEQVHVGIGGGLAVGVGAEEDDLLGLEPPGNLVAEPFNVAP